MYHVPSIMLPTMPTIYVNTPRCSPACRLSPEELVMFSAGVRGCRRPSCSLRGGCNHGGSLIIPQPSVSPLWRQNRRLRPPLFCTSLRCAAACTSASAFFHLRFLLSRLIISLPVGVLIWFSDPLAPGQPSTPKVMRVSSLKG